MPKAPPSPATPHLGRFLITLPFWLHQGLNQRLLSSFLGHFFWLQAEKGQGREGSWGMLPKFLPREAFG